MYGGIDITESGAADCCITARPNCSLSLAGKVLVLSSLLIVSFGIAGVFAWLGAWPVLPFAGLEMLVVALAFYQVSCHERDYERITIEGDKVVLERRDNVRYMRTELNRWRAGVVLQCRSAGQRCRLALCSHGDEIEFGRHLNDEQRIELAQELQFRLGN